MNSVESFILEFVELESFRLDFRIIEFESIKELFSVELSARESYIVVVSVIVAVMLEFFINELSSIIEFVSKEFSQIMEFVTSVRLNRELLICELVEFVVVRFAL